MLRNQTPEEPYMNLRFLWLVMFVALLSGCGAPEGSQQSAEKYMHSQFKSWQAGQETEVRPTSALLAEPPIAYEFYSIAATEPDILKTLDKSDPAFQFKVKMTFVSQAKTELTTSHTYVVTWTKADKKWHVRTW